MIVLLAAQDPATLHSWQVPTSEQIQAIQDYNKSLSAANPVPNGWKLRRKLELVDGAVIEGNYLFLIYKERFVSFFQNTTRTTNPLGNNFANYGYMLLQRTPCRTERRRLCGKCRQPKRPLVRATQVCTGG
ncbi:MAG: hypothetical protein H6728_01500 [Myxococcales bacterium]|nr:hypothetical protein [Myxococcales bacterium]